MPFPGQPDQARRHAARLPRPGPPRRPPPGPDRPGGPRTRRRLSRPARSPPQIRASARPGPPREKLRTRILPAGRRTPSSYASTAGTDRPGSGSAAPAARQCAGPGACPAARDRTVTVATDPVRQLAECQRGGHELGHGEDSADVRNSLGAWPAVASYEPATPAWPDRPSPVPNLRSDGSRSECSTARQAPRCGVSGALGRGAVTAMTIAVGSTERDVLDAFPTKPSRSSLTLRIDLGG
jgi:hypothetical protein